MGPVRTEGKSIFAGYDGQYATWGDQFYHFWEDGLMVGQFGLTTALPCMTAGCGNNNYLPPHPGIAGNINGFLTTSYNGDDYLYLPDESWGALHRWHIYNLTSVHEFGGSGILQPNGGVILTQLF